MNKKTVLSVLLCCAVLSTATSCNHKDSIHSENSTDSQLSTETNFEIDAIQMVKNDYSLLLEDNISKTVKFHSYDDILKRYRILLSNEHNEEATHTIGEYFDTNDYTIETALQSLVINSHRNQTQMGYAIYDINGDLILDEVITIECGMDLVNYLKKDKDISVFMNNKIMFPM